MEHDLPVTLLVDVLSLARANVVADNLDVPVGAEVGVEQGADDGLHATAKDDNGDVVLTSPVVELAEARVELDVLLEDLDALVKGELDAVQHLGEGVAEVHLAVKDVDIQLTAALNTKTVGVGEEVIGIGGGDGAVKVREEDELGVGRKRGSVC